MSVQSCKIIDDVTGQDEADKVGYKEDYNVTVETGDQPATILISNHPDVPKVGDPHPIDTRATVKTRSVKATANREFWILSVQYEYALESGEDNGGGGGGGSGLEVLSISGGVWYEDYIAEQDAKGKLYRNSAGDAIEKTASRAHPMFTITSRSQAFLVPNYIYQTGQVNNFNYSILGLNFKKKTLLFDEFNFKNLTNGYWEYTFKFKARMVPQPVVSEEVREVGQERSAGWQDFQLDAGFREIGPNGELIPIIPKDDNKKKTSSPVNAPWPLDGDGKALNREDFKDSINWLRFDEYPETGFRIFRWDWSRLLTSEALRGVNF